MKTVKSKRLHRDATAPTRATNGDACFDLTSVDVQSNYKHDYLDYQTGIAVEIPENHVGLLFPRSSISKYNLALKNSVGVIDSGYRGEVTLRFRQHDPGGKIYIPGDRICQLMIVELPQVTMEEVQELSDSERGTGGYGSTGK